MERRQSTNNTRLFFEQPLRGRSDVSGAVGTLELGLVCLDFDRFTAHANGVPLALTRVEFDILRYLMQNNRRVVSHEELVERVIRSIYRSESSILRVHVTHLRRKLGPVGRVIETVRGRGFRFADDVADPWVAGNS